MPFFGCTSREKSSRSHVSRVSQLRGERRRARAEARSTRTAFGAGKESTCLRSLIARPFDEAYFGLSKDTPYVRTLFLLGRAFVEGAP